MSPCWQVEMSAFARGAQKIHLNLSVPVKRRRALVATNPIKE
jgi:hypothetical protein